MVVHAVLKFDAAALTAITFFILVVVDVLTQYALFCSEQCYYDDSTKTMIKHPVDLPRLRRGTLLLRFSPLQVILLGNNFFVAGQISFVQY